MKKYSRKSKVKKFKLKKHHLFAEDLGSNIGYFRAEIIKNPIKNIPKDKQAQAIMEISELVNKGWGDFGAAYIKKNILNSYLLMLLRDKHHNLVGVAPVKKLKVRGRTIYSFGLTVVDPENRSFNLLKKMHVTLNRRLILKNFFKGKIRTEFVFITPNIRTITSMHRFCDFIYPDPHKVDHKTGKIEVADEETWNTVKEFLKVTEEKYDYLIREGCVIKGFYDDKPHLIYKDKPTHPQEHVNIFADKYLYSTPGQEIVVRGIVNFWKVLRNEL